MCTPSRHPPHSSVCGRRVTAPRHLHSRYMPCIIPTTYLGSLVAYSALPAYGQPDVLPTCAVQCGAVRCGWKGQRPPPRRLHPAPSRPRQPPEPCGPGPSQKLFEPSSCGLRPFLGPPQKGCGPADQGRVRQPMQKHRAPDDSLLRSCHTKRAVISLQHCLGASRFGYVSDHSYHSICGN